VNIEESFHVTCPECGETEFSHPESLDNDTFVTCTKCGFAAQLVDLKEHGLAKTKTHFERQAKVKIEKELKRMFK
jgi:hypothetical protein